MKLSAPILILFLLSSCASTKQYDGPERPGHELATLTYSETSDVKVVTINENGNTVFGLGMGGGFLKRFKLLPGEQSVTAAYNPPKNTNGGIQCDLSFATVNFQAEANTLYEVQYTVRSREWDVWIKDITNGKMANQKRTFPLKIKGGINYKP